MKKKHQKSLFLPPLRALLFLVDKIAHALEGEGMKREGVPFKYYSVQSMVFKLDGSTQICTHMYIFSGI